MGLILNANTNGLGVTPTAAHGAGSQRAVVVLAMPSVSLMDGRTGWRFTGVDLLLLT